MRAANLDNLVNAPAAPLAERESALTDTETQEAQDTSAPALPELTDARIEDADGYWSALASLLKAAKNAITAQKRADNAVANLAEARAMIRSFIILSDGMPDWSANSDAYSQAVQNAENALYVNVPASLKNRLSAATRQQVRRKYLLPAVVEYVLRTVNGLGDEATLWFGEPAEDGGYVPRTDAETEAARGKVLADPSNKLCNTVRHHYRARDIAIPDGPFQDVVTPTDPGDVTAPPSPLTALQTAVSGAGQIVPRFGVIEALHLLSTVSAKLVAENTKEIENRPQVVTVLARIRDIADITNRVVDPAGQATDEETENLKVLYFNTETDKVA